MIGSINLTLKRLDTGYYDFIADGYFDEEKLSAEELGSKNNSPGQNHLFAECHAKERQKDLLDIAHFLFGSSCLCLFPSP